MDWDAVGAVGEIVGAIAVIGTLIYLARQIGLSVGASSASQNRGLQESYERINELILANPPLLNALENLSENPTGEPESILVQHFAARWMNIWLSAEFANRNEQISQPEFEFYKEDFKNVLATYPGFVPYIVALVRIYPSLHDFEIFSPIRDQL